MTAEEVASSARLGPSGAEVAARVAWSRLCEPGDPVAGTLVAQLGAQAALEWALASLRHGPRELPGPAAAATAVRRALERWRPRAELLDVDADLARAAAIGALVLVPGDERWPTRLDALAERAPFCLFVRGDAALLPAAHAVAVVGSRAATSYGERVAAELAADLGREGTTVVSGGAYGIDAAAHRGALAGGGATIAVLAGGADRLYPAGNSELLERVCRDGVVLSELVPGSVPTRSRFLLRNRLIAALSDVTVVVEAAVRSGALSTARHALALLRPVGAVPGPVTSAASGGCHRLVRDGAAVLVTSARDVAELVEICGVTDDSCDSQSVPDPASVELERILDAAPLRGAFGPAELAVAAGISIVDATAAIGRLEMTARVVHDGVGQWRRVRSRSADTSPG